MTFSKNRLDTITRFYRKMFASFESTVLFEVYSVEQEEFIVFAGTDGSRVMNKETIIKHLAEHSFTERSLNDLIVLLHNTVDIDFNNPVFIGSQDAYES